MKNKNRIMFPKRVLINMIIENVFGFLNCILKRILVCIMQAFRLCNVLDIVRALNFRMRCQKVYCKSVDMQLLVKTFFWSPDP